MLLRQNLAQQIVERTMDVIGFNVNVMNARGMIIGSGDSGRLNTLHEGALLAISQNRAVNIDDASTRTLRGVQPGVNLPIHYHGEVVGVVGITGDPDELGVSGELLRVMAEMMVEQANSMEHSRWRQQEQEDFFSRLIGGELNDLEQIHHWAKSLALDLTVPRIVMLCRWVGDQRPSRDDLGRIEREIISFAPGAFVPKVGLTELVAVVPLDGSVPPEGFGNRLIARLPKILSGQLRVGLGARFEEVDGIRLSYLTADETMQVCARMGSTERVLDFADYSLAVLLSGLRNDWRGEQIAVPWQRLVAADPGGELVETFRSYVANFGDRKRCAQALHIHRNTLRYRLEKISSVSGLDLGRLPDLLQLYLGPVLDSSTDGPTGSFQLDVE